MVTQLKTGCREQVLDAMDRLLVRYGYQKTTVDDLAAEAGIGKGTVYLYFDSKEHVALSCFDRFHERLMGRLNAIAESEKPSAVRIAEILEARSTLRVDYCSNGTSIDDMLAALRKELLQRKERHHAAEAEVLRRVLEEGAQKGELPSCDFDAAAQCMVLATNAFLPYSLRVTQLGTTEEIRKKIRQMAVLLVSGLAGLS